MTPGQFLEFIVSVSIQATLVVCSTYWLCRVVDVPRLQCRLWATCHVLLILLFVTGLTLPHLRAIHPWHSLTPDVTEQLVVTSSAVGRVVLVGWIIGAATSILLLVREWSRAFRFVRSCRPAGEREKSLANQVEQLSVQGDRRRGRQAPPVRLLLSTKIGSPFCCEWHQPLLVLPEFMRDCDPEAIKCIARHELEHLRSGHPLQLFIERLVATVFWFHPVVWWAAQHSSMAREFACDDAAVSGRREVISYLKILLEVAERGMSEEVEGALLFFGRGASAIARRGRRLVRRVESAVGVSGRRSSWWMQPLLVTAALAASCVWAPIDALASARTAWSPWPRWSANVLRGFNLSVRDFEPYDRGTRLHELSEQAEEGRREGVR